jgi:ABC-type transport system substrate-binding protein
LWIVPNDRDLTPPENRMNPARKIALGAAFLGATAVGGVLGGSFLGTAGAQTDTTTDTTASADATTDPAPPAHDPSQGGHMANGITEELLTGDAASQAETAALAAVPGGTIERVESDAEGDAYEAHMVDADGNHVTVKLDDSFTVTSVDAGHG